MIKNIFQTLVSNGVVALVGFVSSFFLPKILSIDEYAIYQTFLLYLSYIGIFHLGFPSGMNIKYVGQTFENIDKAQYKAEMRLLFLILTFSSSVGLIIAVIKKEQMLIYLSQMIFPYCFLSAYSSLLQAWGRFRQYAFLHILMSAVPLLCPIIFYFISGNSSSRICIFSYIVVYICGTLLYVYNYISLVKGIKSNKILSIENWKTEKLGIAFLLGNYINSIFHSVDKQFVSWFGSVEEFSYYTFAISMQGIVMIFISAISQPLYPFIASGKIKNNDYSVIKRFLLIFGSFSGCAYFMCEFVIYRWIPNYISSLRIIKIYFAVFPAIGIINCLYGNFYRIRKMRKRYLVDLLTMLICSILANLFAILSGKGHIGVAVATTVTYYIWLLYGTYVFPELRLTMKEVCFLLVFLGIYFYISSFFSTVIGMLVYSILDFILCILFFKNEIRKALDVVIVKIKD